MVICYLKKKAFVDINFIFTLCANLQYISDHLNSNSSSASASTTLGIYLSVAVEDCGLRSAATNFILCGWVLPWTEHESLCILVAVPENPHPVLAAQWSPQAPPRPSDPPEGETCPACPAHWSGPCSPCTPTGSLSQRVIISPRLVTLTFLVTRCCGLVQHSPAPVIPVPPGGAPLDQLLHDLSVAAGGRQVKRGLVWGPSSGAIMSILPKLVWLRLPGAGAGPAPKQGPGQVRPTQRHRQVERGQRVDVTLVQG